MEWNFLCRSPSTSTVPRSWDLEHQDDCWWKYSGLFWVCFETLQRSFSETCSEVVLKLFENWLQGSSQMYWELLNDLFRYCWGFVQQLFCEAFWDFLKKFEIRRLLDLYPKDSGWNVGTVVGQSRLLLVTHWTSKDTDGQRGIRTPDTLWTYTRFPGVRLQPLGHLSAVTSHAF